MMADGIPDEVIGQLRCPNCGGDLQAADGSLRCARGHSHDIARQGYVSLFPPGEHTPSGDSAEMVAAREEFLSAGHYALLSDAVAAAATKALRPGFEEGGGIVDLGSGTAYYLARLLERLPGWNGLALDASRPALRRAARAHKRIGAVGCDAWSPLPVRSNAAALALNVFAPRNASEVSRILAPGGAFVVVTPTPLHLETLVSEFGLLGIHKDKQERVADALLPFFVPECGWDVEFDLALSKAEARTLVMMGPSARHVGHDELEERLGEAAGPHGARASVRVQIFRKVRAVPAEDQTIRGRER